MNNIEILKNNIEIVVPENGLEEKIKQGSKEKRPLNIKLGFDPTAPDLHIGHAVVLKKLRDFQNTGHKVIVIIGDFTARIGDPTGRNRMRPPLSTEEVIKNSKTYVDQLSKILDVSKIEIRYNSEWLDKMSFKDVVKLTSTTTLAQIMQRDDFSQRFQNGVNIGLHELLYPLMQGQDSVIISADVEIGGTDQLFNCMVGRGLQDANGTSSQIVVCMPLLVGLDGEEKMSKSKGNYIGFHDAPHDMFGKAMSIPDSLLENYIDLATDFPLVEKQSLKQSLRDESVHPMEVKKKIAFDIVVQYHSVADAEMAQEHFESNIQNKGEKIFEKIGIEDNFADLTEATVMALCKVVNPAMSNSEIRRLLQQGGVSIDGETISDEHHKVDLTSNIKLKMGKRGYYEFCPIQD